jgi:hypothetical protein
MPEDWSTEEDFVEALPCRDHDDRANTRPGKLNPKHAFLGGNCAANSRKPWNVGLDLHRRARIIQIHPRLISRGDIRQTPVCPAFQDVEELSRNLDSSGFLKAVEQMGEPLEVHLPHVQIIAHHALHTFVVDTQHLCNLLLGQVSLA